MWKSRHGRRSVSMVVSLVMMGVMTVGAAAPAAAEESGTWCVLVRGETLICVDT